MPVEVIMPKVDMDMSSGKVMTWHVAPGEQVAKGAALFDIETDKAAMEVEAPASGRLHHPVETGTVVAIGAPVAWLYAEGEEVPDAPPGTAAAAEAGPARTEAPRPQAAEAPSPYPADPAPAEGGGKARATPLARGLARGAGLDLSGLAGSGPRGRVQAGDVRAALRGGAATAAATAAAAGTSTAAAAGALSVTRSRGETGAPLVLLHGFASDSKSWAQVERLLGTRPIVRIDLPGHGASPAGRSARFADIVAAVRRTFDDLRLDPAHLVGHSLGGAVALAIADTRPRRVASLNLVAPAGLGPEINAEAVFGIARASAPDSLAPWLRSLVADERLITDAYARAVAASRADPALRAAQAKIAEAVFRDGVQVMDLRAALGRVEMPTRILWGKRDRIIPWRHALAAPGRVALHLFDDAGHIPQVEIAQEVGTLLASHL